MFVGHLFLFFRNELSFFLAIAALRRAVVLRGMWVNLRRAAARAQDRRTQGDSTSDRIAG